MCIHTHLCMHMSFVQQLPVLHEVHLTLRRWHGRGDEKSIKLSSLPQRHGTLLRAAPGLRYLLLTDLVADATRKNRWAAIGSKVR